MYTLNPVPWVQQHQIRPGPFCSNPIPKLRTKGWQTKRYTAAMVRNPQVPQNIHQQQHSSHARFGYTADDVQAVLAGNAERLFGTHRVLCNEPPFMLSGMALRIGQDSPDAVLNQTLGIAVPLLGFMSSLFFATSVGCRVVLSLG